MFGGFVFNQFVNGGFEAPFFIVAFGCLFRQRWPCSPGTFSCFNLWEQATGVIHVERQPTISQFSRHQVHASGVLQSDPP